MTEVILRPKALSDIRGAAHFYRHLEDAPSELELDLVARIDEVIDNIAAFPRAFPRRLDLDTQREIRKARLGRFPYTIIFAVMSDDDVRILALAPDRKDDTDEVQARVDEETEGA